MTVSSIGAVGVIGAPDVAAGLRPLGVVVAGGSQLGGLVDVQMVRRRGKVDGLVIGAEWSEYAGIRAWVFGQCVPVVEVSKDAVAGDVLDRLAAGGDRVVDAAGVAPPPPPPKRSRGVVPAPPPRKKAGSRAAS